jgi:hypothetical protein
LGAFEIKLHLRGCEWTMNSEMESVGTEKVSTELLISAYWNALQLGLDVNFVRMIADELLRRGIQINSEME